MKTLQEIKDQHAKELGFTDFEEMFSEALHTGVDYCVDAIAIKYANSKLDEAGRRVDESNSDYYVVTSANIISLKDKI